MPLNIQPEIKLALVNATADGVNTVVAAVAAKKIRVISYSLTVTGAGLITVQDDAGTPNVLAKFSMPANGQIAFNGDINNPAFETAAGQKLDINNPAGVDTLGHLAYVEV